MNKLTLTPEQRVLHLIGRGVTTPGRLAAQSRLSVDEVKRILDQLRASGRIAHKHKPRATCLLAEVWSRRAA